MRFKHLHTSFISLNYQIVVNKQNLEYLNCVFFYSNFRQNSSARKKQKLLQFKNYNSTNFIISHFQYKF